MKCLENNRLEKDAANNLIEELKKNEKLENLG